MGNTYKFIRERAGLSLHDMATYMGVHFTTVSAWERENGQQTPSTVHQVMYRQLSDRLDKESATAVKSALLGAGVAGFLFWLFSDGGKKK